MALTNNQKKALHKAARMMGPHFNDDLRRSVQRNIGGFYSAADRTATRLGFIACMAFYEAELANAGKQLAATPGYWSAELAKAADNGDSLRFRVRKLAGLLKWTEESITRFISGKQMSGGAVSDLDSASVYWLRKTVTAMQSMLKRKYDNQAATDAAKTDRTITDDSNDKPDS